MTAKPNICSHCGSSDIGQLDDLTNGWSSLDDETYGKKGGRWYCVACGKTVV